MDSPTAQMDSSPLSQPSPPGSLSQRLSFFEPLWERGRGVAGERVFYSVLALWRDRLAAGWVPPENAGFPWVQVKRSLAALVADTPSGNPPLLGGRGAFPDGEVPTLALICAGNTPLLAWPAMLFAVKHGVPIFVKMSSDETLWPQLLKESVAEVDPEAGARIVCDVWPGEDPRTEELISQADAVIAYGSDATVATLKTLAGEKPFLGFGHAVSLGYVAIGVEKNSRHGHGDIAGFAKDILTYDQQGCLSPYVIVHQHPYQIEMLHELLAEYAEKLDVPARTDFNEAALVRAWRAMAVLQGMRILGDDALRWTIVDWPEPAPLTLIPCPGLVQLMPYRYSAGMQEFLHSLEGKVSCLAVAGPMDGAYTQSFLNSVRLLQFSRVCKAGEMQTPPLDWKNGNIDLEAWIAELAR